MVVHQNLYFLHFLDGRPSLLKFAIVYKHFQKIPFYIPYGSYGSYNFPKLTCNFCIFNLHNLLVT